MPVPLSALAAIVMLNDGTAAKSTAPAVPLPATLTWTVLGSTNRPVPFKVAVTMIVVAPSPSPTLLSSTVSVIEVVLPSSSVRLILAEFTGRLPDVPLTVIVSSASSAVSLIGVNVKASLALSARQGA